MDNTVHRLLKGHDFNFHVHNALEHGIRPTLSSYQRLQRPGQPQPEFHAHEPLGQYNNHTTWKGKPDPDSLGYHLGTMLAVKDMLYGPDDAPETIAHWQHADEATKERYPEHHYEVGRTEDGEQYDDDERFYLPYVHDTHELSRLAHRSARQIDNPDEAALIRKVYPHIFDEHGQPTKRTLPISFPSPYNEPDAHRATSRADTRWGEDDAALRYQAATTPLHGAEAHKSAVKNIIAGYADAVESAGYRTHADTLRHALSLHVKPRY